MRLHIAVLFILIISLNANSYLPLFLAQKALDQAAEKLIIKVNSVTSNAVLDDTKHNSDILEFYQRVP